MNTTDYALLDSGHGRKLEQFGPYRLVRPCAQAIWLPQQPESCWHRADAVFDRTDGNRWQHRSRIPASWTVSIAGLSMKCSSTDFGHLGIFPEQRESWRWIASTLEKAVRAWRRAPRVLNLFAYSGGATLAAAGAGAEVCHLDAARGMVEWARENAVLNHLENAPLRWIVDDAHKFLARENRRERRYDAIILDPPTFGRGARGELYKIEQDLPETLQRCRALLSNTPLFLLLSAHTPGLTPIALENLLRCALQGLGGRYEHGEMCLDGDPNVLPLPSGTFCRWHADV